MKKILTLLCVLAVFSACHKDKDMVPNNPTPVIKQDPILKKDTTYQNRTLIVPIDTVIGSWVLDTKDAQGMTAIGAKVSFTYTGAFKPSEDLQNVYFVVKDAGTIVFTSNSLSTVNDAVNSFTQSAFLSFTQSKSYKVEVCAKVLASATDNAGPVDGCITKFELIYQSNGSSENKSLSETGQTINFSGVVPNPTSNLQTAIDPSSPVSDTITGSQEIELLRLKMNSTLGTSIVDDLKFLVSDANGSAVVSSLRVYEGSNLLGSGSVLSQSSTVTLNTNIPINVTKIFSVRAVIGNVNVNASGSNLRLTLDNISYRDPSGIVKFNDTDRVGSSFTLLKAKQVITSIPLPGTLQNGVISDGNKISILSLGGNTATKQLTYKVALIDNATHIDTLSYKNLYLKVNGVIMTNVRFTNSSDQVIDSIGPGDNIVHVTFISGSHEYINPVGISVDYVLGGKFTGFNHQSTDGDVGSIELLTTDVSTTYRYGNSGVSPTNLSFKMWSSPMANAGAVSMNYGWSDMSAGPAHSFAFGSCTADGKNASIGVVFNTAPQVWLRRQ